MMQRKNFQLINASKYKDSYTLFLDNEMYGQSYKFTRSQNDADHEAFRSGIEAQIIVSQDIGNLILMRQTSILQNLNIVIEDILDTASTTRSQSTRPKRSTDVATAALAKLSFHSTHQKVDLPDLVDESLEFKYSLEDYINLISTEPTILAHEVNYWFFSRPELLADEKGRTLPVHTDKYITGAVLDAVCSTVKTAAIWNYIHNLLGLLQGSPDKMFRAIILQELSYACDLEYMRAQSMLKRNVSVGSSGGKWFKRISTVRKDGIVRISMKRSPESLTAENPQLHYLLRLCQDETNWSRSIEWLQKLEDLHRAHPLEKDNMTEREHDSLSNLAFIVTFIQSVSSVASLPSVNHKKGQLFVSRYTALENVLEKLKTGVDLGDFVIPIANLLEPGMATGALTALDEFLRKETGTKIGFLYQGLVEDCVSELYKQYEQQTAKASRANAEYIVPTTPESPASWIEQRKQKEKTRPEHSSIYEITPHAATPTASAEQPVAPPQTFQVKSSTFDVFSSLLSRSSVARGSVSWDSFAAAMTELGFSVIPKVGSIYMFVPPETMSVQRNITLHRPHQSSIDALRLLVYSRRLKRVYGWNDSTFVRS
ncbi:hypothetical protein GQ44DRAFT_718242 [Phaeosphaeriaceae sp. PMI808]|nr:hypothetical protein GQ44DRAFT_718242 [Phaeosphaeriaceae sp. PMI808]